MIYLKNLAEQIRQYEDSDIEKVNQLIESGRWTRINGLKDQTPYIAPKKPKKTKKKSK
tara:strand:+ start:4485 stop:4658 length:174 start_codon:yes stop_codon:yes gene_type:complete